MQITTFKDSKTNFMLFTELNSTMTETEKKIKTVENLTRTQKVI